MFLFDFVIHIILCLFLPGRCLNFSSMMVIVLVLRFTITKCRNLGLSAILPLDHNIFLHKLTGCTIFGLAWFHAIMHICNFCKLLKIKPKNEIYLISNTINDTCVDWNVDFIYLKLSTYSPTQYNLSKWTQNIGAWQVSKMRIHCFGIR